MTIVFTGKIKETRKEIKEKCELHGIRMENKVTYTTDVLFVGRRASHFVERGEEKSKKELEAENKGIEIEYISGLNEIIQFFI